MPRAKRDLEEIHTWLAGPSQESADRWFDKILSAIMGLENFPSRCPLAPESDVFEEEIRQLISGEFRILFTVEADEVHILHIRHGSRQRYGLV